ncbi:MAG: hypothetical protein DLM71_02195 [Chloroflexi bacterium]|nr:MAG: hypothetical protein DLM71_02195 [Chloroflexota bacterium]
MSTLDRSRPIRAAVLAVSSVLILAGAAFGVSHGSPNDAGASTSPTLAVGTPEGSAGSVQDLTQQPTASPRASIGARAGASQSQAEASAGASDDRIATASPSQDAESPLEPNETPEPSGSPEAAETPEPNETPDAAETPEPVETPEPSQHERASTSPQPSASPDDHGGGHGGGRDD